MRHVRLLLPALVALLTSACPPPPRVESPATPRAGAVKFDVNTDPPGAAITVDGAPAGQTPAALQLVPGTHTVKLTASGYFAVEGPVEVPPGGGRHDVKLVASH